MTKRAKIKQLAENFMSNANSAASFSDTPYFVKIPLHYIDELYELAFGPKALFEAKIIRLGNRQKYIEDEMNSIGRYKELSVDEPGYTYLVNARKMEGIKK